MANIEKYEYIEQITDQDGKVISEKTTLKTKRIIKSREPDYIKLYIDTWQEGDKNKIPVSCRLLFLELATRMGYCDADDFKHSQLVTTGAPYQDDIMKALGWTNRDSLQKGLRALCDCNAIRCVSRGTYQVNPRYAAKGQWKYNPRVSRSSLDDFMDYFDREIEKARIRKAAAGPGMKKTKPEKPEAGMLALDLDHWHK